MVTMLPIDADLCRQVTLTLAHFLWQGVVIAVCAALVTAVLRRRSSQSRYVVKLVALMLMVACLPGTFAVIVETDSVAYIDFGAADASERNDLASSSPTKAPETTSPTQQKPPTGDGSQAEVSTAVIAEASRSRMQSFAPQIVTAYLLGVAVMLARLAISWHGGRRLRRAAVDVEDEGLLATIHRVANQLGMRRVLRVAIGRRISGPVVIGVLRPVVLLPLMMTAWLTPQQCEAVLLHAFIHLQRYGHLVVARQRLFEAGVFFHPAVWYVSVTCVAFSSDGRRIASGSLDSAVKVWDAESGQTLLSIQRHTGMVWSVAFSPDGRQVVASGSGGFDASARGQVKIWDATTGKELLALDGFKDVQSVAFSPDGKLVASAGG